jgi:uncharacterized repeat protein (TIGR03803 family)
MRQQSVERQAYHILHKFDGKSDGAKPSAALIDIKGTLYGTTANGGSKDAGTVFSITKSGEETVLHSFGGSGDGAQPFAGLIDVDGTFYGTTSAGGAYYYGTVFSVTPNGVEKVLYSFNDRPIDGGIPYAGLIDVKGTLYGTTSQGGDHTCNGIGCGTVFSITTSGTEKVLCNFGRQATSRAGDDGSYPVAGLLYAGGLLYGTTSQGGKYGRGTIFSLTTAGGESVKYSFGANRFFDGTNPSSALIHVQGALYGTTVNGGAYGDHGTVFSITTDGVEKVVRSFNGSGGSRPYAGLVAVDGTLYGTTSQGGENNAGTVFGITTRGKKTVLHNFGNGSGKNPVTGLLSIGKTLYGTTYGARNSDGNVFSLTP